MEGRNFLDFIDIYVARIRYYEEEKKRAGTEIEIDTLNTYIEMNLACIRAATNGMEEKIKKRNTKNDNIDSL